MRERGRGVKRAASRSQSCFDVDRDDRFGADEAAAEVRPPVRPRGEAAHELFGVLPRRGSAAAGVRVDALAVCEPKDDLERGSGLGRRVAVARRLGRRGEGDRFGLDDRRLVQDDRLERDDRRFGQRGRAIQTSFWFEL